MMMEGVAGVGLPTPEPGCREEAVEVGSSLRGGLGVWGREGGLGEGVRHLKAKTRRILKTT